jgi:hypothetical protein
VKGCVTQHDHVQQAGIAGTREKDLGGWHHPDAADELPPREHGVPADGQSGAIDAMRATGSNKQR